MKHLGAEQIPQQHLLGSSLQHPGEGQIPQQHLFRLSLQQFSKSQSHLILQQLGLRKIPQQHLLGSLEQNFEQLKPYLQLTRPHFLQSRRQSSKLQGIHIK